MSTIDRRQHVLVLCDAALPKATNSEQMSSALGHICIALCKTAQCPTLAAYSWIQGNRLDNMLALTKFQIAKSEGPSAG